MLQLKGEMAQAVARIRPTQARGMVAAPQMLGEVMAHQGIPLDQGEAEGAEAAVATEVVEAMEGVDHLTNPHQ